MSEDRKLLVGIDICDDVTQISVFDRKQYEAVAVGRSFGQEKEYEIPTILAVDERGMHWMWGSDAQDAKEPYVCISNFVGLSETNDEIEVSGRVFNIYDLWKHYIVKCFSLLGECFPDQTISKIVVTLSIKSVRIEQIIRDVCAEFGIRSDRLVLQSHRQSYMYYAVSQAKELWMNSVGLFEYTMNGLFYSQISIDRRSEPYIVGVEQKDLSDVVPYELTANPEETGLIFTFLSAANTVLHKQMVTTIYVTGKGFEGKWAQEALKNLCAGRRVFRGQNLFTKGACYAARELSGEGKLSNFLFLDEDMVASDISIRVYTEAGIQEAVLVNAGSYWNEVDASVDIIPDDEDEIQITTKDALKKETKMHILSLSGFVDRKNKMTRFTVRIRFADKNTCIITLKDNGFGEFCPSSNRIWERYITV